MKAAISTKGVGLNQRFVINFEFTEEELKLHTLEEWKEILDPLVKEADAKAIEETMKKIDHYMLHGGIDDRCFKIEGSPLTSYLEKHDM